MTGQAPIAVVTGASSGIGFAAVEQLCEQGWVVHALSRQAISAMSVMPAGNGRLHHVEVDLADADAVQATCSYLEREVGACQALIHSAGRVERGSFPTVGVAGLDRQYHVNVRAPYALTTALLPALDKGHGTIVFVNSTQGLAAGADAVGYAVTKHALKALADGLRLELSGSGVRVCSIYPGRTDTRGQREIFEYEGREYTPQALVKPETVAGFILAAINLPAESELVDVTVRPSRRA